MMNRIINEAFEAGWTAAYKNMDEAGPILSRAKERYLAESLQLPQPVASQPTELVMGGPESRYRPPIIGTAGQVGEVRSYEELCNLVLDSLERPWTTPELVKFPHERIAGRLHALLQRTAGR